MHKFEFFLHLCRLCLPRSATQRVFCSLLCSSLCSAPPGLCPGNAEAKGKDYAPSKAAPDPAAWAGFFATQRALPPDPATTLCTTAQTAEALPPDPSAPQSGLLCTAKAKPWRCKAGGGLCPLTLSAPLCFASEAESWWISKQSALRVAMRPLRNAEKQSALPA
jgi:hypothetical protein